MPTLRAFLLGCAVVLGSGMASAAEVPGTLTCGRCGPSRYSSCYDPCEPVGPIRRFFRRVFRVPCPQPAPVMVGAPAMPVHVPAPMSAPAPFAGVPSPPATLGAPEMGRDAPLAPLAPPPSPPTPFTESSRVPPTVPPSALRFERMASRTEDYTARAAAPSRVRVLLVSVDRAGERQQFQADLHEGLNANLSAGDWLVYTQTAEGGLNYKGRVTARSGQPTRIDLGR